MIDQVLSKFSLSEARRPNKLPSTPSKSVLQTNPRTVSPFKIPCTHRAEPTVDDKSQNKIERIIRFLQKCSRKRCNRKDHDYSQIKYVCLQDKCGDNFGCVHCFLHSHTDHQKAEMGVCVRDLRDLNNLVNRSYQKMTKSKLEMRNQILKEIDEEINDLANHFHASLQFFKKYQLIRYSKAIKEIDQILLQKSAILTDSCFLDSPRESEQELVAELIRLDIKGIERDLSQQLKHMHAQKMDVAPILSLFQELNSSMSHLMASFKISFPKLYPFPLEKPQKADASKRKLDTFSLEDSLGGLESPHFHFPI